MRARYAVVALTALVAAACGPRQVEVRTAPTSTQSTTATIHMTNNLSQAVNVYVVSGGTNTFIRQVAANTTENLPVSGVMAGSTVTLRATTIDGSRTYSRDNVVLGGTFNWQVP